MQGKTLASLIMIGLAVVLISTGLFTKSWYTLSSGLGSKAGLGLTASEWCWKGECRTQSYDLGRARRDKDKTWIASGMATFYFGLLNVALLAVCAVLLGIRSGSAHITTRIGLFTTIFGLLLGGAFMGLKPGGGGDPGFSVIVFSLGSILGIVGTAMAWSPVGAAGPGAMPMQPPGGMPGAMPGQPYNPAEQQPMAQQPMAQQPMAQQPAAQQPAPQQPAAGTCPTCGQATRYIPEYQRNYCDTCQQYL